MSQSMSTTISAMHMNGEVRAGESGSEDGERSAPERWVMAFKDRATKPHSTLCQETSAPLAIGVVAVVLKD